MSFLTDPLADLRRRAQQLIGANAVALNPRPQTAPAFTREEVAESGGKALTEVPEGILKSAERKGAFPHAASAGGKVLRGIGRAHLRAPGALGDFVEVATADDKRGALAGVAGSRIGAGLGMLVPGFEWATVPAGAFAGDLAGHYIYDHRQQIGDAVRDATRGLTEDVRRYAPLDRLPGNPYGL